MYLILSVMPSRQQRRKLTSEHNHATSPNQYPPSPAPTKYLRPPCSFLDRVLGSPYSSLTNQSHILSRPPAQLHHPLILSPRPNRPHHLFLNHINKSSLSKHGCAVRDAAEVFVQYFCCGCYLCR